MPLLCSHKGVAAAIVKHNIDNDIIRLGDGEGDCKRQSEMAQESAVKSSCREEPQEPFTVKVGDMYKLLAVVPVSVTLLKGENSKSSHESEGLTVVILVRMKVSPTNNAKHY